MANEIKRMQKLAGIITESKAKKMDEAMSDRLTSEEKQYLEGKTEDFLNSSVFNSDIVAGDEDNNTTKEQLAIEFIIQVLEERISYYS